MVQQCQDQRVVSVADRESSVSGMSFTALDMDTQSSLISRVANMKRDIDSFVSYIHSMAHPTEKPYPKGPTFFTFRGSTDFHFRELVRQCRVFTEQIDALETGDADATAVSTKPYQGG